MRSLFLAAGLGATLVLSAPVSKAQDAASIFERQSSCASVYVLVARASTEAQGEGVLATLASDITSQISGAISAAVTYPASLWIPADSSHQKGRRCHGLSSLWRWRLYWKFVGRCR
jgi:hypothetical protein